MTINPFKEAASEDTPHHQLAQLANSSTKLARIVARNNATPSFILKNLANHPDQQVCQFVTSHPNTPKETLYYLAQYFPQEFLDNPIFDFLLLEDPNIFNSMPEQSIKAILYLPQLPDLIFQLATQNIQLCRELANPSSILGMRGIVGMRGLSMSAICNKLLKDDMIDHNHPNTPSEILKKLATHSDTLVRYNVATNKNTPSDILQQLATDSHPLVRCSVATNKNTPSDILQQLATDSHPLVRSVARHDDPAAALSSIMTDTPGLGSAQNIFFTDYQDIFYGL